MHRTAGFSMLELMIALTLGLLVTIAASSVFVQGKRSYNQNEQLSRTQENGRFALKLLQRDLSMAGFLAEMLNGGGINRDAALSITPACGVASQLTPVQDMVQVADGQTANDITNKFPCISDALAGTDAVAIKRVADNPTCTVSAGTGPCGPDPGKIYLLTNGVLGWFHNDDTLDSPGGDLVAALAPRSDWEYYSNIYYIRSYSVNAGDGIPSFCRKTLRNATDADGDGVFDADNTLKTECLAEGIEDLQVEIGVDTDGNRTPDFYTGTPTLAQAAQARMFKFYLLARSIETVPGITNDATYTVGSVDRGPFNDRFLRRVYSSSAQKRN